MKYVRETAAGKSISAWVILKAGRQVATVQAHYGNSGAVTVNVFQRDAASDRSYAAMHYGKPSAQLVEGERRKAYDKFGTQSATAYGGGYDKLTAALSGLWIDGHKMSDHCGNQAKPPRGLKYFPADHKPRRGYSLANYTYFDAVTGEERRNYYWTDAARKELGDAAAWEVISTRADELAAAADLVAGYSSCYRKEGLKYLEALGYTVIQAI